MKSRKSSFVLYVDQREAIEDLSYEEKGMLLDALFDYAVTGVIPSFADKSLLVAFKMFKITMARDSEKYSEICEKRREAIKKRWENAHDTNDTKVNKCIQVHTNDTDSDSDSDSVSDSDSDIQEANASMSIIDKNIREPKGSMSYNDEPVEKKWTFKDEVISFFNEKMARTSIPLLRSIENQRAEMLKARVKQFGRQAVFEVIEKAAASEFLNGANKRGFVATFDWMIKPNNFAKVLDGNYDKTNSPDFNDRRRSTEVTATSREEYEGPF